MAYQAASGSAHGCQPSGQLQQMHYRKHTQKKNYPYWFYIDKKIYIKQTHLQPEQKIPVPECHEQCSQFAEIFAAKHKSGRLKNAAGGRENLRPIFRQIYQGRAKVAILLWRLVFCVKKPVFLYNK
jgi:hypothetical protein